VFVTEQVIPALEESAIVSRLAETEPHPDEDWADEMHKFRQDAEWFLVIVSEASTKSDWIRGEVEWALQKRKGRTCGDPSGACQAVLGPR